MNCTGAAMLCIVPCTRAAMLCVVRAAMLCVVPYACTSQTSRMLAELVDVYPTLAALAGSPTPHDVLDGKARSAA